MFFFYASSWLAEHAADWLIVQGGYYMAAIAMRSFPIIPFRRDHQVPSTTLPPSSIPALPSLHSLFLTALSSCPPLHTLTCTHSKVNRAPPALTEQMGAAEDSRLVFSHSPHFAHTSSAAQPSPFSLILHAGEFETTANIFNFVRLCLCK